VIEYKNVIFIIMDSHHFKCYVFGGQYLFYMNINICFVHFGIPAYKVIKSIKLSNDKCFSYIFQHR